MAWNLVINEKYNQEYRGHAEKASYTFEVPLPDQLGAKWTAEQMINAHVNELLDYGEYLLELRVWEDKSPTWTTKYWVDVTATASPLPWALIIVGVLAVIFIIGVAFSLVKVEDIAEYSPAGFALGAGAILVLAVLALMIFSRRRT